MPTVTSRSHRLSLLVAAVLTAVAGMVAVPASAAPAAAATAAVTVNAGAGVGAVPSNAIGLNTAVYDGHMNDPVIPGLVKAAGITALRYPGGSYADIYNWQSHTAPGGYIAPNTTFTEFMRTAQTAGANPVIAVNYGTGTPALAQGWVQNAVTNNYGITYWEVGNEVYGNGTYGANWEADARCTDAAGRPVPVGSGPSQTYNCGPSTYATNVLSYITAMKSASPNIHVCAVLTTPGYWPDGVTNPATSPQSWNQTVLSILGAKTDCVIVHYYPGGSTVAQMLTTPAGIPAITSTLRSQIQQYAGVNPANVKIVVTEANSTVAMDTHPAALFAADMYMTWLENGTTNVDWWNEHNGPGTPSIVNGVQDYGDQGIFSNGGSSSGVTEPPVNTPFSPYYGIQMLSRLASPGDQMVTSSSSNPLLRVHAVRRANGGVNVLIDNEDPGTTYTVNLAYNNFTPSGSPTVFTLANNATAITSSTQSSAASVTVSPYSLTVVQVPGGGGSGGTAPGAPGQPTVSNLKSDTSSNTSGTATLTWPAGTPGSNPVGKYEVYRLTSNGSALVATTTGTSVTLTGLTIGATYSHNVVTVDTQGNPSLPSAPVTFTVPPPSNATCAVRYELTNSWPGGFGANVTVTNRAATAVNGWSLTFAWPDPGESVQSGWNGTWSQSGSNVTVTNAAWNGTIAANGGSVSLGLNGTSTGPAPPPTVFYLNSKVCAAG